jgi:hypothetical protein
MDRSEKIAQDHLYSRGFSKVVYEPDGNVPPDLLADDRIACEVRRLNENERGRSAPKGLEETEIPFLARFRNVLRSIGAPQTRSWWVRVRIQRPLPKWHHIEPEARAYLHRVQRQQAEVYPVHRIGGTVEIQAFNRSTPAKDAFTLGIVSDSDSGGWVIESLERNLRLCIEEKTAKVASFRSQYPEWWLVLVDHVAYGLDSFDLAQFRKSVRVPHTWDRVVIVNPLDHTHYFEI